MSGTSFSLSSPLIICSKAVHSPFSPIWSKVDPESPPPLPRPLYPLPPPLGGSLTPLAGPIRGSVTDPDLLVSEAVCDPPMSGLLLLVGVLFVPFPDFFLVSEPFLERGVIGFPMLLVEFDAIS